MRHIAPPLGGDPALLVGLDSPDDAAVYKLTDELAIVQSVDFFTPIVDDSFAWGRIAAANAFSDVYAMGAEPSIALNLVGWPRALGFELLGSVLEGAQAACSEAGVTIVGGHSVDDPEPKFGMAVTGTVHPDRIVTKTGAPEGADLVLTKALGTGILSSGVKEGVTAPEHAAEAVASMSRLNREACRAMLEIGVRAATDVTGFGLVGHLREMLAPTLSAELELGSIPFLAGAVDLAARGVLPGGSVRNAEADRPHTDASGVDEAHLAVLFDAQTSGGLLIAVEPGRTEGLLGLMRSRGIEPAVRIGRLVPGRGRVKVSA